MLVGSVLVLGHIRPRQSAIGDLVVLLGLEPLIELAGAFVESLLIEGVAARKFF